MMSKLKNIFIDDKPVLAVILLYAVVLFLEECKVAVPFLLYIDIFCTLFFIAEMVVKLVTFTPRGYFKSPWNIFDFVLIVISIPSVVSLFTPVTSLSLDSLLVLRVLRAFRFFKTIHLFPDFSYISKNFLKALKKSSSIFVGFAIFLFIFAMVNTSLFGESSPGLFGTPIESLYTTFQIFTGEGWNEIPIEVARNMKVFPAAVIKLYFSIVLVLGGIIGLSLVNSIFVDAMVEDNNDSVEKRLESIEEMLREIKGGK